MSHPRILPQWGHLPLLQHHRGAVLPVRLVMYITGGVVEVIIIPISVVPEVTRVGGVRGSM